MSHSTHYLASCSFLLTSTFAVCLAVSQARDTFRESPQSLGATQQRLELRFTKSESQHPGSPSSDITAQFDACDRGTIGNGAPCVLDLAQLRSGLLAHAMLAHAINIGSNLIGGELPLRSLEAENRSAVSQTEKALTP
jgi:hypothetical protein